MLSTKLLFLLLLAVAATTVVGCSRKDLTVGDVQFNENGSQSEWRRISSGRGRFTIHMPGIPKETTNTVPTPLGPMTQYSLIAEPARMVAFGVLYYDAPQAVFKMTFQQGADAIKKQLLKGDTQVVGERYFKSDGRDTVEFVLEKEKRRARATVRTFFVDERNYTLVVVMPNKFFVSPDDPGLPGMASNEIARFFNSMEIRK